MARIRLTRRQQVALYYARKQERGAIIEDPDPPPEPGDEGSFSFNNAANSGLIILLEDI